MSEDEKFTVRQYRDKDSGLRTFEVAGDPAKEGHYDWMDAIVSFVRRFRIGKATVHGKNEE